MKKRLYQFKAQAMFLILFMFAFLLYGCSNKIAPLDYHDEINYYKKQGVSVYVYKEKLDVVGYYNVFDFESIESVNTSSNFTIISFDMNKFYDDISTDKLNYLYDTVSQKNNVIIAFTDAKDYNFLNDSKFRSFKNDKDVDYNFVSFSKLGEKEFSRTVGFITSENTQLSAIFSVVYREISKYNGNK